MENLVDFWRGKRVLVTGHTGFKGAWLCLWLEQLGCDVTGFSLPPVGEHHLFGLLRLDQRIRSSLGDIRDLQAVQHVYRQSQPEIVFHLAAQALVLPSYEFPLETFATNIMGTLNVLEAARHAGTVQAIVNTTTDKCYENNDSGRAFREDDKLGGHDPYSASKAAAEIVSSAYRDSFLRKQDIPMATARAGNIIGGGDFSAHRLVPDIARAAMANENIILRNPESTRPWQYVLDALRGYILLAEKLYREGNAYAEAFNFGPDEIHVPVRALAERMTAALGAKPYEAQPQANAPHEASALALDNSKAKARLGWSPRLSVAQAMDLTAAWYRAFLHDRSNIIAYSERQLNDYRIMKGTGS